MTRLDIAFVDSETGLGRIMIAGVGVGPPVTAEEADAIVPWLQESFASLFDALSNEFDSDAEEVWEDEDSAEDGKKF